MATAETIPGIDLTGDQYVIKQALIRNKYKLMDNQGNLLLRAKQKMFKLKEEFPFVTPDGQEVFTVKAGGVFDIAGDYAITPAGQDQPIGILDKNFTLFQHKWKLRSPDGQQVWAKIESRGSLFEFLRYQVPFMGFIPHKYTIEAPNGAHMGMLEGRLSLKDTYDLTIQDSGNAPKETLVAAVAVIDALEGN